MEKLPGEDYLYCRKWSFKNGRTNIWLTKGVLNEVLFTLMCTLLGLLKED